jgi:multisubunit Na+/H+ antiporter MnhF subunit
VTIRWTRAERHPAGRWRAYAREVLHSLLDAPVVIPVTLLAVAVCALGALVRPRIDVALVLGLLAAIWSRVNTPVEGRVLHTWTADRGFTEADLLSVAALAVVALTLLRCAHRLVRRHAHRDEVVPTR